MNLRPYLADLSAQDRADLAARCGTTVGHLTNVSYGYRSCSPELAVALERESRRQVTRQELCPNWRAIWPELCADAGEERAA